MDIIVEKFKISKILSFNGAMHLKWKLRTCKIQIELETIGFLGRKNSIFYDFCLMLKNPQKWPSYFFYIFEKNTKTGFLEPGNYQKEQSQEVWFR